MILQNLRLTGLLGSCPVFCSFIFVFPLLFISSNVKMGGYSSALISCDLPHENGI